jgi:hypothetical protein
MPMQNVFTGKTGQIRLSAGTELSATEQAAANTVITNNLGAPPVVVGRCTGIHIAVTTNLEEFHEIGARFPVVLQPGDISISGSIDHAYVSGALITLLLGTQGVSGQGHDAEQGGTFAQPAFDIHVKLNDPAFPNASAEIVLTDVKFHNWAFRMPEDEFVMENVTFRALKFQIVDTPGQ